MENTYDLEQFKQSLLNTHESFRLELKKANKNIPDSFWETYSSFANTSGGMIILGVIEDKPVNQILGVVDAEKIISDLWNLLSNENKVSYRAVNNQDVTSMIVEDKTIIIVNVNEAPNISKPVYIDGKLDNTWIRTGDGDRKANKNEIASMLRNAKPGGDSLPADGFTMSDLDGSSILRFKQLMDVRYPGKDYLQMSNEQFLREIGGGRINRKNGEFQILKGTLLFLGKLNAIKECYPHFHLDYFNHLGEVNRWSDRVTDDEPNDQEINIFNFYSIVDAKLHILQESAFKLNEQLKRRPTTGFSTTLRECLVNCLAHADYDQGQPTTKIDVYDGWFRFFNPGKMLITEEQFIIGGDSRLRNEIIMKMFRYIGASERQGFGGPMIFKNAAQNDNRRPEIETKLESTEIRVWDIDLADSYPGLSDEEKNILRYFNKQSKAFSIKELSQETGITYYKARKIIQALEDKKYISQIGSGPSTKYVLVKGSQEFLTQLQIAIDRFKWNLLKD